MSGNFKILSLIALLLKSGSISFTQVMPDTYFENTSGKLVYGLFVPEEYDSSKSYPLVMFLHLSNIFVYERKYCSAQ
jgi:hypothetical protein